MKPDQMLTLPALFHEGGDVNLENLTLKRGNPWKL